MKLTQFHQPSTYSFYARGAQKRKKDSQVIGLFMLSGSTSVKVERKYVGEIDIWSPKTNRNVKVNFEGDKMY